MTDVNPTGSGQGATYFEVDMEMYERDQDYMIKSQSVMPKTSKERYIPDIDMESVESFRTLLTTAI